MEYHSVDGFVYIRDASLYIKYFWKATDFDIIFSNITTLWYYNVKIHVYKVLELGLI